MRLSGKASISLLFFCIAASFILISERKSTRDWDDIVRRKTLSVVIAPNEIDCCESDSGFSCFHLELAQNFADSMGLRLEVSDEENFNKSVRKLIRGRHDIIAGPIPVSTSLKNSVAFSDPVLFNRQVLVQRKEGKIGSVAELAGDTVFVCQKSPAILRVKNLSEELSENIHIQIVTKTEAEMIGKVACGEIAYFVCDSRSARLYADAETLDCSVEIGFLQIEAWAFRNQSPELKKKVNDFMRTFQNTETYRQIYRKYYD